jgi:hypothetical protein
MFFLGFLDFSMSDKSSMDGSDWQNEGDNRSWDSAEDLGVLTSQLCRVCAEASEHMVQCFGERGKEIQLVDKIHTHLPIMVQFFYMVIHTIVSRTQDAPFFLENTA